jgi:uncharacterized protein (TIGR03083 family)
MSTDDAILDELLGAYALDAVEPEEAAAVEEYAQRSPRAADELARLRNAAAAIGATEAIAPPPGLLDSVLVAARVRRPPRTDDDPFLGAYLSEMARYDALLDTLPSDALDVPTFNGLTVHELVIHLAAMESAVAAAIGRPTAPDVTEDDVERRTAEFIGRFRRRPLGEVRALWRSSVRALAQWAKEASPGKRVLVFELPFPRESILVSRSFETWTHADDIRRALDRALSPPAPEVLHRMAHLSVTTMPASLEMVGRAHRDKTARVVLTGEGGGDWLIPLGFSRAGEALTESPDVVLTTDVVAWCRVASERMAPEALPREVEGDPDLADDLAAASSAFATL